MNKIRVIFVGFVNDYELIDIKYINELVDVNVLVFDKIFFKFFKRLPFFGELFLRCLYKSKIKQFGLYDLVIIKDELDYLRYLNVDPAKTILMLRNTLTKKTMDLINGFNGSIYSFDVLDLQAHGFNYYPQYSSALSLVRDNIISISQKYDICFVGKDKGRECVIYDIKNSLVNRYNIRFEVIPDNSRYSNVFCKSAYKYSYLTYLETQLSSKAVLDIVQPGQSSETMRLIEALSVGCKVITNNPNVINHPLYHASNVLYFDSIDFLNKEIDAFMSKSNFIYSTSMLEGFLASNVLFGIVKDFVSKTTR